VRRRIWLALTVVTAASLAVSAGMAVAATGSPTAKVFKMNCKVSLTTTPPADSNAVDQPAAQGSQYGRLHCNPGLLFGGGIEGDAFTVPDSGDTVGTFTQYFKTGTVKGSFNLTPQEANFTATSFEAQTWQGTVKVVGGTGLYKGIKSKKAGTMTCSSPDSVHLSCTQKLKLKSL